MSPSRAFFVLTVALFAAVPSTAAAQSSASIKFSAAGKRALKPAELTLSSSKLTVSKTTVGASAKLALNGSLRFKSGRRSARATKLTLTVGRTSSYVSARLGKKSLRLLTVTPTRPAKLDAARGAVTVTGARVALTKAAAKRLRSSLKLKRTPSTRTLGKLSVTVAPAPTPPAPAPPAPAPQPTPIPVATPTPTATPAPTPEPGTPDPIHPCVAAVTTPVQSLDWFGCALPGSGDLKSWTNYLHMPFPALPGCVDAPGSITASDGAARIADSALDHRLAVTGTELRPDGTTVVTTSGTITYRMPTHGIEESLDDLRIVIAADGRSATVLADGASKPRDMSGGACATAPVPYTAQPVLALDLTRATTQSTNGVRRWIQAPATLTSALIGGGSYPVGAAWGAFTIALPA